MSRALVGCLAMLFSAILLAASGSLAGAQVTEEWSRTTTISTAVDAAQAYDELGDMFVDPAGSVYLTGSTRNAQPVQWLDIFILKYAPDGTLLWSTTYDGPGGYNDSGVAIRSDIAGNVYVAGTSQGDLVTLKYAPDGTLLWVDRQARSGVEASDARRLELSPDGAIYVMGGWWSDISYPVDAYLTIRFNPDGSRAWTRLSDNGLGNLFRKDSPVSMAVDAAANVYVTGTSSAGIPDYDVVRTVKYDASGHLKWNVSHPGESGFETVRAMALSPDGNALFVGGQNPLAGNRAYLIRHETRRGSEEWVIPYDPGFGEDLVSLVVDPDGNAFAAGSATIEQSTDWFGFSVTSAGSLRWTTRYDGESTASYDQPARAARDGAGCLYVTGSTGPGMLPYDYDFVTIKFGPTGEQLWRAVYDSQNEQASRVAVDAQGNVFVAGTQASFGVTGLPARVVTIKYAQMNPSDVELVPVTGPLRIEPARPNPFLFRTTLGYVLAWAGPVRVTLCDVAGRLVVTLINREQPAGSHSVTWNGCDRYGREVPPGFYVARFESGGSVRAVKLIRMK